MLDLKKIRKLAKHIDIADGWKSIYLKNGLEKETIVQLQLTYAYRRLNHSLDIVTIWGW